MSGLANSGIKETKEALAYAIEDRDIRIAELRDALLNLNAAIDYHWNDSFTGVQRMPDAHAKMIVAAQQVAKQALENTTINKYGSLDGLLDRNNMPYTRR